MALNTSVLRVSKLIDAVSYFRSFLSSSSNESITDGLINAVERLSVDPFVFVIWLGVSRSILALKQAIQHNGSVQIRSLGLGDCGRNSNPPPEGGGHEMNLATPPDF
ncbi:hypothetical protein BKA66DRAFT_447742 [Pyrenochaeta sp. MPI-SDFR-AT-0127]|nr:hypothetical protein BKA66DRAFT_447742 [Pyrenochaeta sp. MPI-SDFR-AT-0127]